MYLSACQQSNTDFNLRGLFSYNFLGFRICRRVPKLGFWMLGCLDIRFCQIFIRLSLIFCNFSQIFIDSHRFLQIFIDFYWFSLILIDLHVYLALNVALRRRSPRQRMKRMKLGGQCMVTSVSPNMAKYIQIYRLPRLPPSSKTRFLDVWMLGYTILLDFNEFSAIIIDFYNCSQIFIDYHRFLQIFIEFY